MKRTLILTGALALLLGGMRPADAQLSLTFLPDTQTGAPGTTVTFSGTLTNTSGATVFLNSDTPSLVGSGLSLDDSKFFANAPLTLAPGGTTGIIELFDVVIDPSTAFALYPGSFSIVGGADANAQDTLAIGLFNVNVAAGSTSNVPEPGSIALLVGMGLSGAGLLARRKRTGSL